MGELKQRPRGYGFIVFNSKESLLTALCYEHIIDGRVVDCSVALDPKKGEAVDQWPQEMKIHVSHLPLDTTKEEVKTHLG